MPVLAVVQNVEEAAPLVRWAGRFAWARETTLTVLLPSRGKQAQESSAIPLVDVKDEHSIRSAVRAAAAAIEIELKQGLSDPHSSDEEGGAAAEATAAPEERPPSPAEQPAAVAESAGESARESARKAAPDAEPTPEEAQPGLISLRAVVNPDLLTACLDELRAVGADFLVVGKQEESSEAGSLGLALFEHAPCDVLLLRASGKSGERCGRVLVAAAGGPHAGVALRLGAQLSTRGGAYVRPLYVQAGDDPDGEAVGKRVLTRALRSARVDAESCGLDPQVLLADRPWTGIRQAAEEGFDLVLVGASNQGVLTRFLFGTVPDQLLSGAQPTAVAVVRRARPLIERTREWLGDLWTRTVPQLERQDRVDLFERLQVGSRANVDFMALIAASTGLASLGLLQDSAAVVIGAMLVAPLMMPMIGAGLALIQGNVPLVRDAARSITVGFLIALAIGILLGLLHDLILPDAPLPREILARGEPNLLDLLVAFLSGLAAAYALARPNLMGAMAGVAIAAALVPPIASAGIALAKGKADTAQGAALLFGTNLVAIVLGAAFAFRLVGVQPKGRKDQGSEWANRIVLGLTLLVGIIAVPLASYLLARAAKQAQVVVTPGLERKLETYLSEQGATLVHVEAVEAKDGVSDVDLQVVIVTSPRDDGPDQELIDGLAQAVAGFLGRREPLRVRVKGIEARWTRATSAVADVGSAASTGQQ